MEYKKLTQISLKYKVRILFIHLSSGKIWISFQGISIPNIKDIYEIDILYNIRSHFYSSSS